MTTIELTDEQQKALQAEQGTRINVVNPATQQRYVLLAWEQYERVRPVLDRGPEPSRQPEPTPARILPPDGQALRIRLRDLPTPPEITEEANRYCKELGMGGRKDIQQAEDQMKLQYYYGGKAIYVVRAAEGPVVIPIEERHKDTPDLRYVLLTPEERPRACYEVPSRWQNTVCEILM